MFMILVLIIMELRFDILDIHKYLMKKYDIKMFGFVKRIFLSAMMFFGCNLLSVNPLECISINNQECKVRRKIININSDEPVFYPLRW